MRVIEKTVYTFEELNDRAKEKARDWYREGGLTYTWWDSVYTDAHEVAKILGIEMDTKGKHSPCIYFTGFYSQGSGSSFVGHYKYVKGAAKKIRQYAPQDIELHKIADALQGVQSRWFYKLQASIDSRRDSDIEVSVHHYDSAWIDLRGDDSVLEDLLKDFNHWIFKQLEREYEWLMSDEQVDEMLIVNEYEFDEDGGAV